jgi:Domain of unknown function (DUF4142)
MSLCRLLGTTFGCRGARPGPLELTQRENRHPTIGGRLAAPIAGAQEKTFASQMITDHTKTSEELKSMAPADGGAAIPVSLDSSSQSKIDKLRDAKSDVTRQCFLRIDRA